jgi:hypothetical protein
MAKLTDLPTELLTALFRHLLSRSLVNHGYLCEWKLEEDAMQSRAALYALSMVCKAFSHIALPLLYEQLFDSHEVQRFMSSNPDINVIAQRMACVRYLYIDVDMLRNLKHKKNKPAKFPVKSFYMCLAHCSQLVHLRIVVYGTSTDVNAFLLEIARMPALRNLRSLSINVYTSDGRHSLFLDLCHFSNLLGLCIDLQDGMSMADGGQPLNSLASLKQLEMVYGDSRDISAFIALASPDTLEILEFWGYSEAEGSDIPFSSIFGAQTWRCLEHLTLANLVSSASNPPISYLRRLPALRKLRLNLEYEVPLGQALPTLPSGLQSLAIGSITMDRLLEILNLIKDRAWLVEGLLRIKIDVESVHDQGWEETYSKEHLLSTAQEAVEAARSSNVMLDPGDLLGRLEALQFWEHSQTAAIAD